MKGRKRWLLAIAGVLTLIALFWARTFYVDSVEQPREVDLDNFAETSKAAKPAFLNFAIAPILSPGRTVETHQSFAAYLAKKLKRPIRLVQRKTYHEVNELLRHHRVDMAIICTGAYLQAQADRIPLKVVVVPIYPHGPYYHSYIVVSARSNIKSLADLRGRSFAYSDPLSLSGHYYPLSLFLNEPGGYFARATYTYSHDGSLKAVLDGIADGTAVDSLVYEYEIQRNPSLEKRLRIVHRSPRFGVSPVVLAGNASSKLRRDLSRVLLEMHTTSEGSSILQVLGAVRFDRPPPDLYDVAGRIVTRVRRHRERSTE